MAESELIITTIEYDPSLHKTKWDAFVDRSMNGTVFHKQQFLEYHPEGRFDFHHLMFFQGEHLVAVLPGG
ncbi:MAG TPA: GNAT family N-acetyltransferase, partial [Candidatus Kapabacteria bacterium]|nr:GNAT family N-acetyltransferase [Candidatus Kapabacteria bacterium]